MPTVSLRGKDPCKVYYYSERGFNSVMFHIHSVETIVRQLFYELLISTSIIIKY